MQYAIAPRVRGVACAFGGLLLAASGAVLRGQQVDGAKIYAATCAACHQPNGLGTPGQFPPLAGSEWVTGSEERLVRIILHGLVGEIEVEGETFTGAMPTWGPTFKDEELAAVATYVRRSWGNTAPPVARVTVTRVRLAHLGRRAPWTAKELATLERSKAVK